MFKYTWRTFIVVVLFFVLIITLFINMSPEFGDMPAKSDKTRYEQSDNYKDGKFVNQTSTSMDMGFVGMAKTLKDFIVGVPNNKPDFELPVEKVDSLTLTEGKDNTRLIWFGHSAFLLQMDGLNILIDPMFGDVPAPHPWLGRKRYSKELPIEIEKLPAIDLIIFSHDHYDHLDYGSIQKLKSKTKKFFVPLGVGAHLKKWGVATEDIQEFDWWDETEHEGLMLAFTPARHFSGRGLTDRFSTLWGSWVIKGKRDNIYFSGDSGYGPHFKEIGEKYGPFDFAMMECGQYNERWSSIHMMPEETAQAAVDINTKMMMPIHWGAFTLALHSWTDPVERLTAKANELGMPILIPVIGSSIQLGSLPATVNKWWVKPSIK